MVVLSGGLTDNNIIVIWLCWSHLSSKEDLIMIIIIYDVDNDDEDDVYNIEDGRIKQNDDKIYSTKM